MLSSYKGKIERAYAKDFEEIVHVWESSVRATHHFLKEEDILYFKPLILNEFLQAVDLYCIRDEQKNIAGFIGIAEDKVEMLFIKPEVRGKGIGKAHLEYAKQHLNVRKVEVNEQNEQAVGFYEKMGFQVVSRSAFDHLQKPFPLLSMELI